MVEPPKQITARHVAAVFEKMGYDAAAGTKVFGLLMELLAQEKARQQQEELNEEHDGGGGGGAGTESGSNAPGGIASGIAAAGGGSSSSSSSAMDAPVYSDEQDLDPAAASARGSEAGRDSFFSTPLYARKPRSSFTASLPFSSSSSSSSSAAANAKMDVADFVR